MYKVSGRVDSATPLSTYYTDSLARALNTREKYGRGVQIDEVEAPPGKVFTIVGKTREGYPIGTYYYDSYADALNRKNEAGGTARIESVR